MNRRRFLSNGVKATAAAAASSWPRRGFTLPESAYESPWRVFEVGIRVDVDGATGPTRAWLPLPLRVDTDYQKNLGHSFQGNAAETKVCNEEKYGADLLCAQWPDGEASPRLEVTCRFATRDRAVDWAKAGRPGSETPGSLAPYLQSSRLIRTDGIVAKTAAEITRGAKTDFEKARAIYEWIVDNTFRDPKVRGCGIGDIRAMLETGYLGGKCADLNGLFVGLLLVRSH